ncbi:MAG: hypothetical protein ACT4PZ_05050 [Panacagrimonas sp.]
MAATTGARAGFGRAGFFGADFGETRAFFAGLLAGLALTIAFFAFAGLALDTGAAVFFLTAALAAGFFATGLATGRFGLATAFFFALDCAMQYLRMHFRSMAGNDTGLYPFNFALANAGVLSVNRFPPSCRTVNDEFSHN